MKFDDFFENLSYAAQKFFINYGFEPEDEYEANIFVKGVAGTNLSREIIVEIGKKQIVIDKKHYKLALYPKVWKKLSPEDRVYVLTHAYKQISKDLQVYQNIPLMWFNFINGSYACGGCPSTNEYIYLGMDFVFSKNAYSGLTACSLFAHELNHAKQNLIASRIFLRGAKTAIDDFDRKCCSSIDAVNLLSEDKLLKHLSAENKKHYQENKKSVEWLDFKKYLYNGNQLEIASANVQKKFFKRLSAEVYQLYGKSCEDDINIANIANNITDIYNPEKSATIYNGHEKFVNKLALLIEFYDIEYRKREMCISLINDELKKRKMYEKLEKPMPESKFSGFAEQELINIKNVLKYENLCIAERQQQSYDGMYEIFKTKEINKEFNFKLFDDIDACIDAFTITNEQLIESINQKIKNENLDVNLYENLENFDDAEVNEFTLKVK